MNQIEQTTGQRTEQMGVAIVQRSGEMAANAMASKQKALVEARYIIAYNRPRSILQARSDILAACQRPGFAESARYAKPIGGTSIEGFSIRFAEEAIKAMKNINVESVTIYEDEERRTVQISVTDLESNVSYSKEVTVAKTVERRQLKDGQVPISKRLNSQNQTVYLVAATEDDIANKVASAESKIIRNCGLRLVPSDILEEAEAAIAETLEKGGGDKNEATKKIVDAFGTLNIGPTELEKYLKHGLATISPKELKDLRAVFTTIKEGSAAWADYLTDEPGKTKPNLGPKTEAPKEEKNITPLPVDEKPKNAAKPAKAKVEKEVPKVEEPPAENQDGDLGPQKFQYEITDALAAKLADLKVSRESLERWIPASNRAESFKADFEAASEKLLGEERSLKLLQKFHMMNAPE